MEKRFIGAKELSAYLGSSINTVYAWVSMGKLPHLKFGKLLKFDLRKIDLLTDRLVVETNKELAL